MVLSLFIVGQKGVIINRTFQSTVHCSLYSTVQYSSVHCTVHQCRNLNVQFSKTTGWVQFDHIWSFKLFGPLTKGSSILEFGFNSLLGKCINIVKLVISLLQRVYKKNLSRLNLGKLSLKLPENNLYPISVSWDRPFNSQRITCIPSQSRETVPFTLNE